MIDELEDPKIDDIACDYVEQCLGRLHFRQNWERVVDKLQSVRDWMSSVGDNVENAEAVVREINRKYNLGLEWKWW